MKGPNTTALTRLSLRQKRLGINIQQEGLDLVTRGLKQGAEKGLTEALESQSTLGACNLPLRIAGELPALGR